MHNQQYWNTQRTDKKTQGIPCFLLFSTKDQFFGFLSWKEMKVNATSFRPKNKGGPHNLHLWILFSQIQGNIQNLNYYISCIISVRTFSQELRFILWKIKYKKTCSFAFLNVFGRSTLRRLDEPLVLGPSPKSSDLSKFSLDKSRVELEIVGLLRPIWTFFWEESEID